MAKADDPLPRAIMQRTTQLLVDLCSISSASGDHEGVQRLADRMAVELSKRDLAAQVGTEPDAEGNPQPILIACGPQAGEHYLLLVGHMDTVLDAIPPRVDGHLLYGTGALDMKGGLAMLVGALDLLAHRHQRPPEDLILVAVPDEEVAGTISERAVKRWGADARAILVIEPGEARGDAETLVAGRRGLSEWRLDVTGRASHSGLAYWEGRSALAAAADWAAQAQRMSELGPGPTVNVARLVAGDSDFVNGLAAHFALLGTSRRRNVISDRAVAEGEVRFLPAADGPRILERLERLAETLAAHYDVKMVFARGSTVPPVDAHGPSEALVEVVTNLAAQRGFNLEVEEDRGGISFPNYVGDPSKVPIVDGLGPVGDGMHTREEYLDLRSLGRRIVLLADILATL